jgi:hypothetical protein
MICEKPIPKFDWHPVKKIQMVKKNNRMSYWRANVSWPKIVLLHRDSNSCYLIGGVRPENQEGSDQCLLLNIETKEVRSKKKMFKGRVGCGVCLITPFIYVTGGLNGLSEIDQG